MPRVIFRTITQRVELTEKSEYDLLMDMAGLRLNNSDDPLYLPVGTPLRVTEDRGSFSEGQIVLIKQAGTPDADDEYYVWHLKADGELDDDYISADIVKVWNPDPPKRRTRRRKSASAPTERPRKRKLDLSQ